MPACSCVIFDESKERGHGCLDRLEIPRLETAQAVGEPGGPAGANAPHQPLAILGEAEPDAPSVVSGPDPLEEPCALKTIDMTRHRGWRDALLRGELGEGKAGVALHEPEKRRLPRRNAELLRLLAQLACEPQQDGPKVGRD